MRKIRWGIIGLGKIAHKFAHDVQLVEDAELYGVASRSQAKADEFKDKFQAVKAFNSYNALFEDPAVDIVYIATPHSSHAELSIQALNAGKHVLCEKPFALNKQEVLKMIEMSRNQKRFLMEAFWTRFNPVMQDVIGKVKNGEIDQIKYIHADFSFRVEEQKNRLFDLTLGGGALLDIGIYPIFLSYVLLGMPKEVIATAIKHKSGIDYQTAILLKYDQCIAQLYSGFATNSNMLATIEGETGRIEIHPIWHQSTSYSIQANQQSVETIEIPVQGLGYYHEIVECHNNIRKGNLESEKWSLDDSLNMISILDEIRELIELDFK